MYRYLLRPFLFLFSPEQAHFLASIAIKMAGMPLAGQLLTRVYGRRNKRTFRLMGLEFPSRVGLAAGFDKNATLYRGMASFGFGFLEVGTVTPLAQAGNPRPRLFRLKAENALLNRMGFNNDGVKRIAERLKGRPPDLIIGGNIGKGKLTPNDRAVDDYITCFEELYPHVDYFTVNVSSPNTPGLRELQDGKHLSVILGEIMKRNNSKSQPRPVLLKISPDLNEDQLSEVIEMVGKTGIAGVIAANTTTDRSVLDEDRAIAEKLGQGGISGMPLKKRSLEIVRYLARKGGNSFAIIASGGIFTAGDAIEYMEAGADLVQLYTAIIYRGPSVVSEISSAIENYRKP